MAVKKPSIDFSDAKQLTEFTRKKPNIKQTVLSRHISLSLEWMSRRVER
jgi:hypothetical protein